MKFSLSIEDIKYVKILYMDINHTPVLTKGAIKRVNEREIIACIKYEDGFVVNTPQEITLSIICNEGLYRTKTKLKSYASEPPYVIFYMETPAGLEYEQNREYFRISAAYNCAYYVQNNGQPAVFTAQTFDISANGVSILLPVHIFSEEDAEIEMMIENKIVTAKICYVRSEKLENGYKLSFTYTKISDHDRDYISQVCLKKQLENKRNKAVN